MLEARQVMGVFLLFQWCIITHCSVYTLERWNYKTLDRLPVLRT